MSAIYEENDSRVRKVPRRPKVLHHQEKFGNMIMNEDDD